MELITMDEMRNRIVEAQAEEDGQWSYKLTDVIPSKVLNMGADTFVNSEKDKELRKAKEMFFLKYMDAVVAEAVEFGYKKCIEHMSY